MGEGREAAAGPPSHRGSPDAARREAQDVRPVFCLKDREDALLLPPLRSFVVAGAALSAERGGGFRRGRRSRSSLSQEGTSRSGGTTTTSKKCPLRCQPPVSPPSGLSSRHCLRWRSRRSRDASRTIKARSGGQPWSEPVADNAAKLLVQTQFSLLPKKIEHGSCSETHICIQGILKGYSPSNHYIRGLLHITVHS